VAVQIGKRNLTTLKKLWRQIPGYLRQHLDFDTDGYKAYGTIIPESQHFADKPIPKALKHSMAASVDWYAEPARSP
jgi:hypothetical protein